MRTRHLLLTLSLLLPATGCPPPAEPPSPPPSVPVPEAAAAPPTAAIGKVAPPADAPVYDVVCGCKVESVGRCGEYAVVEGKPIPITPDLGLGDMPFCGKQGLKARIAGKVEDGKLGATAFAYVE